MFIIICYFAKTKHYIEKFNKNETSLMLSKELF